jgi:hypothetical protein
LLTYAAIARRAALGGVLVVLTLVAWGAVWGGFRQMPRAETSGQRAETAVQIACGVLSVLTALTCFRWRRWAGAVRVAWAASLALGVGLSGLVWGPPMPWIALLMGAGTLLAALLLIWAMRAWGRS